MLGDSEEGAPSSEEEGEELVTEERSEELSDDEDLRAVVNSSDEEEEQLDPADPQTLYKRLEEEEFNAGIAAMQARLAAKKAQVELPTQRRKRKGGDDEVEEEAGEEEEAPATIPVPDDELPAVAALEKGAAGSDGEETVPIPMKPPAPRDDTKRRRTTLTLSSLLDEPDAKEVLASMRSAGSFRQAPQALRERKGTSFIADKAEKKDAAAKGSKPSASLSSSSSSSLSASASLSLSHSGYVFGRDSGTSVTKAKPAAAISAPGPAAAKGATDPRKRSVRLFLAGTVQVRLTTL